MSYWQFIEQERASYPVELLCQTVAISSARYYAWRKQPRPALTQPVTAPWEDAKETFGQHKRCYGTRRLRVELQAQGHRVGRLRAAMRRHGLRAIQPRAYTPRTTDSTHGLRCAPNRLLDQPKSTRPNQMWVSNITEVVWTHWGPVHTKSKFTSLGSSGEVVKLYNPHVARPAAATGSIFFCRKES